MTGSNLARCIVLDPFFGDLDFFFAFLARLAVDFLCASQKSSRFGRSPLLLEKAHSISRHVQVDDDMKMGLGCPYAALGGNLDIPILTMHRHFVHSDAQTNRSSARLIDSILRRRLVSAH
ncbi:MAG: hypothetical protein ACRD2L_23835 [Terriglobia bacterium]